MTRPRLGAKLLEILRIQCESPAVQQDLADGIDKMIQENYSNPILPRTGESLALSIMTPKTAALAFDRIYKVPGLIDPAPDSLSFYGATLPEILWWAGARLAFVAEQLNIPALRIAKGPGTPDAERENLRSLSSHFPQVFGSTPTLFYHAVGNQLHDFPGGPREVLTAVIRNVALVDEKDLSWEQVVEFRQDSAARAKYRRLVRWIDSELAAKSPAAVEDLVAIRLDDYEWALRKHGLRGTIGSLSCLLDPKFLAATSAVTAATSLAAGQMWAGLTTAALTIGRAVLSFGSAYIDGLDEQRKSNYEVAYVHEISRRFGQQ